MNEIDNKNNLKIDNLDNNKLLNSLLNNFINELELPQDIEVFKDDEILPIFLDWLCENIDLRDKEQLVALIERDSGYIYIVEAGGNQAFI